MYKITTKIQGTEEYLVIQPERGAEINTYHLKMIERNSIFGIFPIKSQQKDGMTILNYPIGNRFPLLNLIKQKAIGSKEVKVIYSRLVEAIVGMGEYFLNASQCVYDVNYLYVDTTLNPYFIYVPVEGQGVTGLNRIWRDFFLELLSYASNGQQDVFYDQLMRFLIQPNFTLQVFKEFLKEQKEQHSQSYVPLGEQREEVVVAESNVKKVEQEAIKEGKESKPFFKQTIKQDKKTIVPEKVEAPIPEISKGGVLIPGMPAASVVPVEVEVAEPVKEKKHLFGFGKKKKEKQEKVLPKENIPIASEQEKRSYEIPKVSEQEGTEWSKTVFITPPTAEEDGRTVMVEDEPPHLMHGEVYIPLLQFPFTIGRLNTDYILNNATITKTHAKIFKQNGIVMIQDEGSSNGTFVNGEKLSKLVPVELRDGTHIRLSKEEFTYYDTSLQILNFIKR